jgi:cysteine desulfurase/selenocysteine lyase
MRMDAEKIRQDFPLLLPKTGKKPLIYLDNSATSLKPRQVIDSLNYYYTELSANIHRGVHRLSEEASRLYEESHKKTAGFIKASGEEIVFTRNTTESLNLLMYSLLMKGRFSKGDSIVLTEMEHHSNIVPWQFVEQKTGAKLEFVKLNPDYTLDLDDLASKVSEKTKLVSVTHVSNTVASVNPVREIGKIAHENNALFAVDAAQSAPHMPLDFRRTGADFMCFSAHKMLGPTGIGVFCAKKSLLEEMPPFLYGGDMIQSVDWHKAVWNRLPYKFEAGTPNIAGGIAFSPAIDYLKKTGMDRIESYERKLTGYALEKMKEIKGIRLHCPQDAEKQAGIILFDSEKLDAHDIALALDEAANIAVRSGMHCAEPLVSRINPEGAVRASFYFYNTMEEIDTFADNLKRVVASFG